MTDNPDQVSIVEMAVHRSRITKDPEAKIDLLICANAVQRLQGDLTSARAELARLRAEREWRPIESAPRTGHAFLAYGVHTMNDPPGAQLGVRAGDHWWAIILWNVWSPDPKWVFAKDGAPTWSAPSRWQPLLVPTADEGRGG